jgi:hypothetical protein
VRLAAVTDGRSHAGLSGVGADDHHAAPRSVEVNNTSQVIAAGATFNLDLALGTSVAVFAHVAITGPRTHGGSSLFREGADVYATRAAGEAIGHSFEQIGLYQDYAMTYSKQNGDTNLSTAVFSNTALAIALRDAVLTGSNLRLTFVNVTGSPATLWVKGRAILG